MTTSIDTPQTCPCCGNTFESPMLMSTNQFATATDFMPVTGGMPFIPLEIHTCPKCGYSACGMFMGEAEVPADIKSLTHERLAPLVKAERPSAAQGYKFAAMILEWRGAPEEPVAQLYLRAAWCCRLGFGGDGEEDERFFLREAVERLEAVIGNGTIEENVAPVTYLVGELYRRLGDTVQAERWFQRVPEAVGDDDTLGWLLDAAVQQQTDPKEEFASGS